MGDSRFASIKASDLDRLEFVGIRHPGGSIEAMGRIMPTWPEHLLMDDVLFRLEETDERVDAKDGLVLAWYVVDE